MSGRVETARYMREPTAWRYGTERMAAMSSAVVGEWAELRGTEGSRGVVTVLQSARPKRSRRSKTYWCCDRDKVQVLRSRLTSTPSRKDVGPRSRSLKCAP